jgi:hypothetical protein
MRASRESRDHTAIGIFHVEAGWWCSLARLLACAVTIVFAAPQPAAAQVTDVCQNLDNALVAAGKETDPKPADDAAAKQHSIALLSTRPPQLAVKIEGDKLAGPGVATFSIEDRRVEALTDTSKLCTKVFTKIGNEWKEAKILQIFFTGGANNVPKRLNVTFEVRAPDEVTFWSPSQDVRYVLIAALSDAKQPALLNYWKDLRITSRWLGFLLSLALVVGSYLFIAFVTFEGASAGSLLARGLYFLHPVRISSASYGEASMSQLQVLLFTLIVGGLLFHLWFTTLALSDISTDLLKLLGISAVGAVGAKFTHTLKTGPNDQCARYLIGRGWYNWVKVDVRESATFRKLLLTDDRLDIYKFQIAIFTIVVACYVLSSGQSSLGDVKISETMLYLIGISQGVYIGGKAVTDRTTDLEAAVQKMIDLEAQIRTKEAALGSNPRTAELIGLDEGYKKAAIIAAQEFASLQHRKYPKSGGGYTTDIQSIDPDVLKP